MSSEAAHNPYEVLQIPDFRRYLIGGIFAAAGTQMTNVAAGWELYERTGAPWSLGLLGLMAALPVITLALPAGTLADRAPRKRIVLIAEVGAMLCLALLARVSEFHAPLWMFYVLVLLNAICGAFLGPALGAMVSNLVPPRLFAAAAKWSSIRWQLASTLGPVAGGFLVAYFGIASVIFALDCIGRFIFCAFLIGLRPRPQEVSGEKLNWQSVIAGWGFVRGNPLILSTITLDMVAVLFGGATALLPVYARDVLQSGPESLGVLRAAPAVGAILMGIFLAHRPPFRHTGKVLLYAVAGFGFATIVFGLSKNYFLNLGALALLGAFDNISVVIRQTLIQLLTPDSMRGRVGAVNSVFIGTSNEIGELESGLAAQMLGPVLAVAGGGVLTIGIVAFVAVFWPQVRRLGRMEDLPDLAMAKDEVVSTKPLST